MRDTNSNSQNFLSIKELKKIGFVMKTLYGEIEGTEIKIRGFYSSLGNRQPQIGDLIYSDNGTKLEILNNPKDQFSYLFKSYGLSD